MKPAIPAIGFAAWSGTGKTTIIENLLPLLKQKGLRVAVIKHDAHDFEMDREGKDSWRFTQAGADLMILNSAKKTALIEPRCLNFSDLLGLVHDVDLILVEGFSEESLPRIGISRKATGKGFRHSIDDYIALVTDEDVSTDLPVFAPDDVAGLGAFILDYFRR